MRGWPGARLFLAGVEAEGADDGAHITLVARAVACAIEQREALVDACDRLLLALGAHGGKTASEVF